VWAKAFFNLHRSSEKLVRHQKINEGARTVTLIVSIWVVIFLGIVVAAMIGR
jgi:hypothetical protein